MNIERLKKSIGSRIQLQPTAVRLDQYGFEQPKIDDEWIVESVTNEGVVINNIRTSHRATLGLDHIHHYTTNPQKSGGSIQHGFLTLIVQVYLQGYRLWVRPTSPPGARLPPDPVRVNEKIVDITYPSKCGLQAALQSEGYRIAWCLEPKVAARCDIEGWERVVHADREGVLTMYRLRDRPHDQILIKKLG